MLNNLAQRVVRIEQSHPKWDFLPCHFRSLVKRGGESLGRGSQNDPWIPASGPKVEHNQCYPPYLSLYSICADLLLLSTRHRPYLIMGPDGGLRGALGTHDFFSIHSCSLLVPTAPLAPISGSDSGARLFGQSNQVDQGAQPHHEGNWAPWNQ